MGTDTYSVSEAQAQFPKLARTRTVKAVANRGRVTCFIVPRAFMAAVLETQEILADPKAMKAIRDHEAGKTRFGSLDEIPD